LEGFPTRQAAEPWRLCGVLKAQLFHPGDFFMNGIVYIVGLIVIVMAVLSLIGLR